MKNITQQLIDIYNLKNIDFMGYEFNSGNVSYHHLLIPRRLGGEETIENGAILNRKTSHPYLHIIEGRDLEMFNSITNEMIIQKMLGKLDIKSLKKIHDILTQFEREHSSDTTKKGKLLIKEEYTRRPKLWLIRQFILKML